ncbi:NAD(P)-binding protein [bacterium]|nr:NAD(P)-binding protein [bacterium]
MSEKHFRGQKVALIIGAGPAGLAAANELLSKTDYTPLLIEKEKLVGGIARTVSHKGNLLDLGPHHFITKENDIWAWWRKFMPTQGDLDAKECLRHCDDDFSSKCTCDINPDNTDDVMLIKKRLTRIYHDKNVFEYPMSISYDTIRKLGFTNLTAMAASYGYARLFPRKPEATLEDFFINRFGHKTYKRFFESYSEKVWGMHCSQMGVDLGAHRVRNVSIGKTIGNAVRSMLPEKVGDRVFGSAERSFAKRFVYPKLGSGQLWTKVADHIESNGGIILREHEAVSLKMSGNRVVGVNVRDLKEQKDFYISTEYCFSSAPIRDLISSIDGNVPRDVAEVASGLRYRGLIVVGMLLKNFVLPGVGKGAKDHWIYVQEPYAKAARFTIFNNWSPLRIVDPRNTWLALELYAQPGDEFWNQNDDQIIEFASRELGLLNVAGKHDVLTANVVRVPEATPMYAGEYNRIDVVEKFVDDTKNLFLIGRNGMHRYNNQDHAVMSGIKAVESIVRADVPKADVWLVNAAKTARAGGPCD